MGRKKHLEDIDAYNKGYIDASMNKGITVNSDILNSNSTKLFDYKVEIKCKNKKQKDLLKLLKDESKQICIVHGSAGSGKSYISLAYALSALKDETNNFDKIIITVPTLQAVSSTLNLGFLRGDLNDKVINYLININTYQKTYLHKLNILYKNLSRIEEFINSNNLIQKKNGVDNENIQKINNNDSQYMDNSLMKDFIVQLKRIGESNYKFYETQKPGKEEQVSDNNDNSKGGDVQEAQPVQDNSTVTATATDTTTIKSDNNSSVKFGGYKSVNKGNNEMPVLLGSLIYDEHWFKSTIDEE